MCDVAAKVETESKACKQLILFKLLAHSNRRLQVATCVSCVSATTAPARQGDGAGGGLHV